MNFKETRLCNLLKWMGVLVVGAVVLIFCFSVIEEKNRAVYSIIRPYLDTSEQLEQQKQALLAGAFKKSFALLGEKEKEALQALPRSEQNKKMDELTILDAAQIDEIITIDKQLMALDEKSDIARATHQKKVHIAYYFLMFLGLLLALLSSFVTQSILQLLLAAIGTSFFLYIGGWLLYVDKYISYPLQMMIVAFLLAAGFYTIWHLLAKRCTNMHRYLFLQMFGAISLAFALCTFTVTLHVYFLPKTEAEKLLTGFEEKFELPRKEQRELLAHDQLNTVQKERYFELINESKNLASEELDRLYSLDQTIIKFVDPKLVFFIIFALLYILLGLFVHIPLPISVGLLFSGCFMLLLSLTSLFQLYQRGLFSYTPLIVLFVAAILAFAGYHLYHQRRE